MRPMRPISNKNEQYQGFTAGTHPAAALAAVCPMRPTR